MPRRPHLRSGPSWRLCWPATPCSQPPLHIRALAGGGACAPNKSITIAKSSTVSRGAPGRCTTHRIPTHTCTRAHTRTHAHTHALPPASTPGCCALLHQRGGTYVAAGCWRWLRCAPPVNSRGDARVRHASRGDTISQRCLRDAARPRTHRCCPRDATRPHTNRAAATTAPTEPTRHKRHCLPPPVGAQRWGNGGVGGRRAWHGGTAA